MLNYYSFATKNNDINKKLSVGLRYGQCESEGEIWGRFEEGNKKTSKVQRPN